MRFLQLINYSLDSNKRWRSDKLFTLKYVLLLIFFFVSWLMLTNGLDDLPFTEIFMYIVGIMTAVVGTIYCAKPSMLRLVPVSYKRKVFYYYASIAIYSLIATVVIFALLMLIALPIAIGNYCTDGSNFFAEEGAALFNFGAQEYLFSLFKMIFNLSLISIASRMEKKRGIIIAFVVLFVAHFGGIVVLSNLITTEAGRSFALTRNIYPYFSTLPNPTLAVILSAVFAVVAFALSFAFIVYKSHPRSL
jgi:hypothetical protein